MSGAVKRDSRPYIRPYTSPIENFEYGYPHSNAILQFCLKLEHCKLHKAAYHPTKCDVINGINLFLTVYRRIYCRTLLMLSNQMSRYKSKCIRILIISLFFFFQITYLEGIIRTHEANVCEIEADSVRLTQVSGNLDKAQIIQDKIPSTLFITTMFVPSYLWR